MKAFTGAFLAFFIILSSGLNFALAQNVDVAKINNILKGILDPIVAQDAFFSDLSLVVDPATDITKNYVSLELSASSKNTIWTPSLSTLDFTVEAEVNDVDAVQAQAVVNLALGLDSDIYAFLQYIYSNSQTLAPCPNSRIDEFTPISELRNQVYCRHMLNAINAPDFNTIKTNLVKLIPLIKADLKSHQILLESRVSTLKRKDDVSMIRENIQSLKQEMVDLDKVTVSDTEEGIVAMIPVHELLYSDFNKNDEITFFLKLNKNRLEIAALIKYTYEKSAYEPFIDIFKNTLLQLESNEPQVVEYVSSAAESYLELVKHYLTIK